jgi:hypothetical protein
MPPLCTVGYGLAIGNMSYAGGAMYLFCINAVFIALATFIVAKILRFPLVRYANSKRRRLIAQIASLVALVVVVPSVILFLNLLKEQVFTVKTKEFVRDQIKYEGAEVVKFTQDYESKKLEIYLIGNPVPSREIDAWREIIKNTEKLEEVNLRIYQGADNSGELTERISGSVKADILSELYVNNEQRIRDKDERIFFLENEITKLTVKDVVPFEDVSKELKVTYEDLTAFGYSKRINTNFDKTDTLAVFNVSWKKTIRESQKKINAAKITEILKIRMKLDTLLVIESK